MSTIFNLLKRQHLVLGNGNEVREIVFEVHQFYFIIWPRAIKLYVYCYVVEVQMMIVQFMMSIQGIFAMMWVEYLNPMAKCINFPCSEVGINFRNNLLIQLSKLLLCHQHSKIKVSIMSYHLPISVGSK